MGLWAAQIALADLSDGIVAYWPLDDEVNDAVGSHDGALVGGASLDAASFAAIVAAARASMDADDAC